MDLTTRLGLRSLAVLLPLAIWTAGCSSDDGAPTSTINNTTTVAVAQATVEHPTPPPLRVDDLCALGPGAFSVSGDAGFAAIFDANGWRVLETGAEVPLYATWGTSPGDVYFAGESGCLLHWDGSTLTELDAGSETWGDAWVDSTTGDLWLVSHSAVARRSGTTTRIFRSPELPGPSYFKAGIAGSSTDDVWVVGNLGTVLRWDGSSWSTVTTGLGSENLNSVAVFGEQVFIAADDGELWRYDGTDWWLFSVASIDRFNAVAGIDASRVVACGSGGAFYRWNGTQWTDVGDPYFPTYYDIQAVCLPSGATPVVGGHYDSVIGNVSRRLQGTWHSLTETTVTRMDLTEVWVHGAEEAIAVGSNGTILERDASGWSEITHGLTTEKLWGVWGSGPADVYAVGDNGVVLHRDASTWTSVDLGADDSYLYGVAGSSAGNVWAVGARILWHWNGSSWTNRWNELPDTLVYYNDVYVAPSGDVFLAGDELAHFDGSRWETIPLKYQYGGSAYDICGSSENDVWMTGYPGVYHYDGEDVSLRWSLYSGNGTCVSQSGPDNVLAGDYDGLIQFREGIPAVVPLSARGFLGAGTGPDGTSYLVGERGLIVRVE